MCWSVQLHARDAMPRDIPTALVFHDRGTYFIADYRGRPQRCSVCLHRVRFKKRPDGTPGAMDHRCGPRAMQPVVPPHCCEPGMGKVFGPSYQVRLREGFRLRDRSEDGD